jgi:GNAT superfamily N-acetyltransferase
MTHPLANAMHENYVAALQRVTLPGVGGASIQAGPWTLLDAGSEFDLFNVAAVTGPAGDPAESLQVAIRWFAGRERPFRFVLREGIDTGLIGAALELGYKEDSIGPEPAMLLEGIAESSPPPPGFSVLPATEDTDLRAYASVEPGDQEDMEIRLAISQHALKVDGCSMFVGRADGRPVARSMSLRSGPLLGVYNVFVVPECRGKGYGAAITAAAVAAGREAGATAAALTSSPLGFPVYQRMGFRTVYRYVSLWRPVS